MELKTIENVQVGEWAEIPLIIPLDNTLTVPDKNTVIFRDYDTEISTTYCGG